MLSGLSSLRVTKNHLFCQDLGSFSFTRLGSNQDSKKVHRLAGN